MKMRIITSLRNHSFIILLMSFCGFAQAVSVSVPGNANPYLAGMPDGSTAPPDQAPDQSPIEVQGLSLSTGGILTFSGAIGGVSNTPACVDTNCSSIDGNVYNGTLFWDHEAGAQNGISDIRAPINSLIGVFLTDSVPNLSPAPAGLDFQTFGLNFTTLSPQIQQVFFIGDGMTSGNVIQQFLIPDAATRLFLGTMDGTEWVNNSGAISIHVAQAIPEPEIYMMLLAGLGLMAALSRRRRIS